MTEKRGALAVTGLGTALVVAGIAAAGLVPAGEVPFLPIVVGTAYATVGVVGVALLDWNRVPSPLAFAPGLTTVAAALMSATGLGLLSTGDLLIRIALVTSGSAVAFAFPLGLANSERRQWVAVGVILAALSGLFALLGRGIIDIDAESAGLLVIASMLATVGLAMAAVPAYLFGRSLRETLGNRSPSPLAPLLLAAVPFLAILGTLVALPYMLSYPPIVLVAGLAAGALFVLGVNVRRVVA
jgi:hypothetical protein